MRTYTESEMINTSEDVFIEKNFIPQKTIEEPHTHEFVELVYVLSGKMENYVDDRKYELTKGDILFVNYNQVHRYIAQTDLHFVNLLLKPEFMSKKLMNSKNIYEIFYLFMSGEMEDIENNQPSIKLAGKEMIMMERIIDNCIDEFQEKRKGYLNILQGYMQIIFNMIIRNMEQQHDSVKRIKPALNDIIKYIDEHYNQKLTVETLAEQCFYNTSYFSRVFRECYGKSCTTYIKEKRLEEAMKLLEKTDVPVEEIIRRVGYNDKSLFYRQLKKFAGITPSELRTKQM